MSEAASRETANYFTQEELQKKIYADFIDGTDIINDKRGIDIKYEDVKDDPISFFQLFENFGCMNKKGKYIINYLLNLTGIELDQQAFHEFADSIYANQEFRGIDELALYKGNNKSNLIKDGNIKAIIDDITKSNIEKKKIIKERLEKYEDCIRAAIENWKSRNSDDANSEEKWKELYQILSSVTKLGYYRNSENYFYQITKKDKDGWKKKFYKLLTHTVMDNFRCFALAMNMDIDIYNSFLRKMFFREELNYYDLQETITSIVIQYAPRDIRKIEAYRALIKQYKIDVEKIKTENYKERLEEYKEKNSSLDEKRILTQILKNNVESSFQMIQRQFIEQWENDWTDECDKTEKWIKMFSNPKDESVREHFADIQFFQTTQKKDVYMRQAKECYLSERNKLCLNYEDPVKVDKDMNDKAMKDKKDIFGLVYEDKSIQGKQYRGSQAKLVNYNDDYWFNTKYYRASRLYNNSDTNFSAEEKTSLSQRNLLMTIIFINSCFEMIEEDKYERIEHFIVRANEILWKCRMQGFYYVNPFDRFLYILLCADVPLELYTALWSKEHLLTTLILNNTDDSFNIKIEFEENYHGDMKYEWECKKGEIYALPRLRGYDCTVILNDENQFHDEERGVESEEGISTIIIGKDKSNHYILQWNQKIEDEEAE